MKNKKKFLVTGASGFVGACLVRKLVEDGQDVNLILRDEAKTWRIDDILDKTITHTANLLDKQQLQTIIKKVKPDIIYHLATEGAYSQQNDQDKIFHTNVLGTLNLLTSLSDIDYELFVNTGSSSEYGFKNEVMRETDLLEPNSYYAVAKSAQTLLCNYVGKSQKKPTVTLRLFSVYGPYEEPTRLIPTLLSSLLNQTEMKLVNPEIGRDMIYVEDVVDAFLEIEQLKKFPGECFNICSGKQTSIKVITEEAVKATGKITKFTWGGMENRIWDTTTWVGDNSKIKQLVGWQPYTNLHDGIKNMWKWYKVNKHLYGG